MAGIQTRYNPKYIEIAREITNDGGTLDDVAREIGVERKTVLRWMDRYKPFRRAVEAGRETASEKVVESLYRRATGYETVERKTVTLSDGSERIEVMEKSVAPSVQAILLWLNNVLPDKWKDKKEVEVKSERPIQIGAEYEELVKHKNDISTDKSAT